MLADDVLFGLEHLYESSVSPDDFLFVVGQHALTTVSHYGFIKAFGA
jgi:hypothetical protein